MNNRNPFRNSCPRTFLNEAADTQEINSANSSNQVRCSFRHSAETSTNSDVSHGDGLNDLVRAQSSTQNSFRSVRSFSNCKQPFRNCCNHNYSSDNKKTNGHKSISTERLPFRPSSIDNKNTITELIYEAKNALQSPVMSDVITAQPSANSQTTAIDKVESTRKTEVTADHKHKAISKSKESFSASYFKELILGKVPFIKHSGGLYAYNGRTYVAVNSVSQLVGIVINQVDNKMFGLNSTNIFSSILTMLQEDDRLIPIDYKERVIASENIVVFKNTLLDVRTLKRIPFNPWYITSFEIDVNFIVHPEPEVFLDYLNHTSGGDKEISSCISDFLAYILSGTNQGKMFFVMGNARDSGKSSLAAFLQGIINEKYICNVAPNEFKDRFSLGGSRGRIINISMDLPSTPLHTDVVATIKKNTGGDRIMSQEKNEKKEFGVSSLRLIFGSNHPVLVNPNDNNASFWERLQVIPFIHTIAAKNKDPHLVQKLLEERDDVVSYCVQRIPDIIKRRYKLSPCQVADDIKNEWRYGIPDDYSLESFCETYLDISGNKADVVLATDIYSKYKEY